MRVGEVIGLGVSTVDLTQMKLAEDALRRHAEMLDLSHDAIIVWRPGGTIESWNRGAEELYGFSQAEALGRVSHDLLSTIHERPWQAIEATLRSAAAGRARSGTMPRMAVRSSSCRVIS